jgi:hypothetical protein
MSKSKARAEDWGMILGALDAKTAEIAARGQGVQTRSGGDTSSEAARWDSHVRRIIDEIALFVKGE